MKKEIYIGECYSFSHFRYKNFFPRRTFANALPRNRWGRIHKYREAFLNDG